IKAYEEGAGKPKQTRQIVDKKPFTANKKIDNTYIRCVIGKDFHRYHFIQTPPMFLSYGEWLAAPRINAPFFEPEKIIIRQTADSLICHLDTFQYINLNNVYNVGRVDDRLSIRYLLGLLNSNLLNYIYQDIAQEKGKLFAEVKKIYLEKLPIKVASPEEQQVIAEKVNQLLQHYKALSKVRIDLLELLESNFAKDKFTKKLENWFLLDWAAFYQEIEKIGVKMSLKKQKEWKEFFDEEQTTARHNYQAIQTLEKSINELVYQLYNLTAEEIAWIENDK
ncbi:MAG: TaqI-like C-terminal specificity domain-containing protein, partial [Thermoflexibacteraceae bacterium]